MLLKILVEGAPVPGTKVVNGVWIVQDNLPFSHPQNLQALMQALKLPPNSPKLSWEGLFIILGGKALDVYRSPVDHGLTAGTVLTLSKNVPSPVRPRRHTVGPNSGGAMSPRTLSEIQPNDDDDEGDDELPANLPPGEADEQYGSLEDGWFPFLVKMKDGQPVSEFINPEVEPSKDDLEPHMRQLCSSCAVTAATARAMDVDVDRHYKPMLLDMDSCSGWLEKLSGSTFQRWQRRWFIASDKSIDWYDSQPKPNEKQKVKGSRPLVVEEEFQIASINDKPDHPKCKEAKYFHFSVTYKAKPPAQPTVVYYRGSTQAEMMKPMTFLQRLLKRSQESGANRDPVFWKRWVDNILCQAADLGGVMDEHENERLDCEDEIEDLEQQIRQMEQEQPLLEKALGSELEKVDALKMELQEWEEQIAKEQKRAEVAEEKVVEEQMKLDEVQEEFSEELRQHKFLEQRAQEQLAEAKRNIAELERETDEAKQRKMANFSKWRKFEEHHADRVAWNRDKSIKRYSFGLTGVTPPRKHRDPSAAAAEPQEE